MPAGKHLSCNFSLWYAFFGLQKQPNHSDCGLFAIANANGQSPEVINYNTKVMRKHLAGYLEDKLVFHHFPARKRSVKYNGKLKIGSTQGVLYLPFAGRWRENDCL